MVALSLEERSVVLALVSMMVVEDASSAEAMMRRTCTLMLPGLTSISTPAALGKSASSPALKLGRSNDSTSPERVNAARTTEAYLAPGIAGRGGAIGGAGGGGVAGGDVGGPGACGGATGGTGG